MSDTDDANPQSQLTITCRDAGDELLVAVAGQIDFGNAHELNAQVNALRPLPHPLTLDLTSVTFFDSSGVRALVDIRSAAVDDTGVPPRLRATENIDHVLEMCGIREIFRP